MTRPAADMAEYIEARYRKAVEIGIGHDPRVAQELVRRGIEVTATDRAAVHHPGLAVVRDDVTEPRIALYQDADVLYAVRPPPELVPHLIRLARIVNADLLVKALASDFLEGRRIWQGNSLLYLWSRTCLSTECQGAADPGRD